MSGPGPIRRRAVAHAAALLVELQEAVEGLPEGPVEAAVSDGVIEVRVVVVRSRAEESGGDRRRENPPPEGGGAPRLTPLDRLILAKLTAEPCTMAALANRCGHDNDRYFQRRVQRLREAKLVAWDFHGYRLPR